MEEVRESLSGQAGLLVELMTAAMEPHLRETGMTLSIFEMLSAIHALRSNGTQADVARRLGITAPSLSEGVKLAIAKGFVEQDSNPRDARTKLLRLTPKGSKALRQVVGAVKRAENTMIEGLSIEEIAVAIKVLRRANKNLAMGLQHP